MLYEEIIAVYFEDHTKLTNSLYMQNSELMGVKEGGTSGHSGRVV